MLLPIVDCRYFAKRILEDGPIDHDLVVDLIRAVVLSIHTFTTALQLLVRSRGSVIHTYVIAS